LQGARRRLPVSARDADRRAVVRTLEQAVAAAEHELSNLTRMRARELIGDEEFATECARLQRELAGLRDQLTPESDPGRASALTAETFVFAARAYDWFLAGDADTRQSIVDAVGSNLSLKDKIVSIEAKKPFRLIDEGLRGLRLPRTETYLELGSNCSAN